MWLPSSVFTFLGTKHLLLETIFLLYHGTFIIYPNILFFLLLITKSIISGIIYSIGAPLGLGPHLSRHSSSLFMVPSWVSKNHLNLVVQVLNLTVEGIITIIQIPLHVPKLGIFFFYISLFARYESTFLNKCFDLNFQLFWIISFLSTTAPHCQKYVQYWVSATLYAQNLVRTILLQS